MEPSHDASKVKAEGPGLSRTGKDDHSLERLGTLREIGAKYPYMIALHPQVLSLASPPTSQSMPKQLAKANWMCNSQGWLRGMQYVMWTSLTTMIIPTQSSTLLYSR